MKKILILALVILYINPTAAFPDQSVEADQYDIKLMPEHQTIHSGETARFELVRVKKMSFLQSQFFTERPEILRTVNFKGEKSGDFPVKAEYQGKVVEASVTVLPAEEKGEEVFVYRLLPEHQTIMAGSTAVFKLMKVRQKSFLEEQFFGEQGETIREVRFEGKKAGDFTVTAAEEGQTVTATVTVEEPEEYDLIMEPPHQTIRIGETAVFQVIKVVKPSGWRETLNIPSREVVARVEHRGVETGEFAVQGSYQGRTISGICIVTEDAPHFSLYMEPRHQTIEVGQKAVFQLIKTEMPKSGIDLFRSNPQETVGTVEYEGTQIGTFDVHGEYHGAHVQASVTVVEPEIVLEPAEKTIKVGETAYFQILKNSTVEGAPFSEVLKSVSFPGTKPGQFEIVEEYGGRTLRASVIVTEEAKQEEPGEETSDFSEAPSEPEDSVLTEEEFSGLYGGSGPVIEESGFGESRPGASVGPSDIFGPIDMEQNTGAYESVIPADITPVPGSVQAPDRNSQMDPQQIMGILGIMGAMQGMQQNIRNTHSGDSGSPSRTSRQPQSSHDYSVPVDHRADYV